MKQICVFGVFLAGCITYNACSVLFSICSALFNTYSVSFNFYSAIIMFCRTQKSISVRYFLVILGIFSMLSERSFSQYIVSSQGETVKAPEQFLYNNLIGASASSLTGYGIQYQRRLTSDFRLRLVGIYYERTTDNVFESLYNVGLESQFDLFRSNSWTTGYRVYWLAAARTYSNITETSYSFSGSQYTSSSKDSYNAFGTGLGLEILISSRLSFQCDLGYALYNDREFFNGSRVRFERALAPSFGIGVGFMF